MENMKTYCYLLLSFLCSPFRKSPKKKKAYLVIIWMLIWFLFTSLGRKGCNLTIKKLKHVQKAYNCIILQRECAPSLSTLNQFQFRPLSWSEIVRFEIGCAIYILIIATSFLFSYIFIQLDFCYITISYYH